MLFYMYILIHYNSKLTISELGDTSGFFLLLLKTASIKYNLSFSLWSLIVAQIKALNKQKL